MQKQINKKKNIGSIIATTISVVLLVAGTVGLVLLQRPLQEESLDIRQQASVDNGQVSISSSPATGAEIDLTATTIDIKANTAGVQTDGVQLVFNLIGKFSSDPTISISDSSGLSEFQAEVQQTADGYLISLIGFPMPLGQTFSATTPTTIAQLNIEPSEAGNIELNFDREKSKSIIHGTTPPEDSLTHVDVINFVVADDVVASPSPTPDATPEVSPSPSPSPTPATGGVTVQGCNDSCSSNSECETNHRCYNGQCRLVTNVSSTTCVAYDPGDQGLDFGCNEYCADSNECDDQYTCLENKCRRSDNPDDASCRIPSSTIQANITSGCNVDCSSNKDCSANLRCYYGECRLATNVSSTTCAAKTTTTVSSLYEKKAVAPKGGDIDDQMDDEDEANTLAPLATIKPTSSPSSYDSDMDEKPLEEQTALDAMISKLEEAGIPLNLLPIIALAIGGLLLLLIVIPKLFGKKDKYGAAKVVKKQQISQENQKYEQELQAKLAEIKKQPITPAPTAKPPVRTPVNRPIPPVNQPVATPNPQQPPQPRSPQSSMMDRVKQKGINQPR